MGGQAGNAVADGIAAAGVGGQKKLETLGVGGGSAPAIVHIAAADPARARRDADLIVPTIVANDRAHRVGTVAAVVARLW